MAKKMAALINVLCMRYKFVLLLSFVALLSSCGKMSAPDNTIPLQPTVINSGLRYCEGTLVYKKSLLISNFGTTNLFPLNNEGKGYIAKLEKGQITTFIPADGNLSAPKGMAAYNNYLLIADVNRVVCYDLQDVKKQPQVLYLPFGNEFVNDIVINNQYIYISVTNSGKIFRMEVSQLADLENATVYDWLDVPGANGMVLSDNKLYVASYPADGVTTSVNVIYFIDDVNVPKSNKLISRAGQYDGLALYKNRLYFTDWDGGKVGFVDLATNEIEYLTIEGMPLIGAADISVMNGELYVPILTRSELLSVKLSEN